MAYNENIQFTQTIIHDINTTGTSIVEFLHKSKRHWCAREQIGPRTTLVDPMFIEELEENETVEYHFVEV
jgi:hypothetical protein